MKNSEIKEAVLKGGELAIQRLIDRKRKENGYIVISKEDKVIKVNARDIKL